MNITNNDVASLVINPATVTVVGERHSHVYRFVVSQLLQPVTWLIDLVSNNTAVATINIPQLTFTTLNWGVRRTITVTGVNNNTVPNTSTTISLTVNNALSDDTFDGVTGTVNVNVTNDDLAGFIVNPLTIDSTEGGPPASHHCADCSTSGRCRF